MKGALTKKEAFYMKKNQIKAGMAVLFFLTTAFTAGIPTLSNSMSAGGYVLTGAYGGTTTVLLDSAGKVAFKWDHNNLPNRLNGYSSYLLENGNLLRSAIVAESLVVKEMAPRQGIIEEIDPSGNVVWRFTLADDDFMLHHDMKPMPNGHILATSFIYQTKEDLKTSGVDTSIMKGLIGAAQQFVLSEKIIEIDTVKANGGPKIIWEWRMPDHIIKGDSAATHPELFSGTMNSTLFYQQWVHLNGLDYNEELDMILFSSRLFSELFIIDHGLTTQEAAGHTGGKRGKGGDILYRWGKPANYKASGATTLNVLHCVNWIPKGYPGAGNIIFFHNNTAASKSQVIEIKPPMDANGNFAHTAGESFGPAEPAWIFSPAKGFFSFSMSSALRLPNGNTLAHLAYPGGLGGMGGAGGGVLVEIDSMKNVVWSDTLDLKGEAVEEDNPATYNPAKIMYYKKDYKGVLKLLGASANKIRGDVAAAGSVPPGPRIHQASGSIFFSGVEGYEVSVVNLQGKNVLSAKPKGNTLQLQTDRMAVGLYYTKATKYNRRSISRMINVVK
jgi:hypothetical protein